MSHHTCPLIVFLLFLLHTYIHTYIRRYICIHMQYNITIILTFLLMIHIIQHFFPAAPQPHNHIAYSKLLEFIGGGEEKEEGGVWAGWGFCSPKKKKNNNNNNYCQRTTLSPLPLHLHPKRIKTKNHKLFNKVCCGEFLAPSMSPAPMTPKSTHTRPLVRHDVHNFGTIRWYTTYVCAYFGTIKILLAWQY